MKLPSIQDIQGRECTWEALSNSLCIVS
jgi:hypothetical protein